MLAQLDSEAPFAYLQSADVPISAQWILIPALNILQAGGSESYRLPLAMICPTLIPTREPIQMPWQEGLILLEHTESSSTVRRCRLIAKVNYHGVTDKKCLAESTGISCD